MDRQACATCGKYIAHFNGIPLTRHLNSVKHRAAVAKSNRAPKPAITLPAPRPDDGSGICEPEELTWEDHAGGVSTAEFCGVKLRIAWKTHGYESSAQVLAQAATVSEKHRRESMDAQRAAQELAEGLLCDEIDRLKQALAMLRAG